MATKLVFVRHGETEWNAEKRWQGHLDVPLSDVGRAQAAKLAARVASWEVDALYCSDLVRALETAAALGQVWGMQPVADPDWRERDVGVLSGLTKAEVTERYPGLLATRVFDPPESEPARHFRERVVAAFEGVVARHPDQTVVVVSHGGVLYQLLGHTLGLAPEALLPITGRVNTGLTVFRVTEEGPRLVVLNDSAHLEGKWEQ